MTKTTRIVLLAGLALVTVADAQAETVDRKDLESVKSAFPSLDEVSTVADLGGKLFQRLRARRNAVLKRWVSGDQVDQIAANTGYTIPNVIQTITNYKAGVEKHRSEIATLLYEDEFPVELQPLAELVWREIPPSTSGSPQARKETRIYLEGATTYGQIAKVGKEVWRATVGSDNSYWFCKDDAVKAVKVKLATRQLAN